MTTTPSAIAKRRNVLNQYTAVTEGGAAVASPAYDDDGNMTEYKDKACTWNAENRLVEVETGDKKVEFLYVGAIQ